MKRIEQMSLWERAYVPEIVRVQYPEERASYPDTLASTEKCTTKDTELNLKSVRNEASPIVLPCSADLPSVALIKLPESASDD